MLPLLSITPACGPAAGGLVEAIRLWPVENVVRVPADGSALVLADPAGYADLFFQPGTAQFGQDEQENDHGIFQRTKLQLAIPDDEDVAPAVTRLIGRRFLAAYLDANGRSRLIGSKEYPLKCVTDYSTGRRANDRNGYDMLLSADIPGAPAASYPPLIVITPPSDPSTDPTRVEDPDGNLITLVYPGQKLVLSTDFDFSYDVE